MIRAMLVIVLGLVVGSASLLAQGAPGAICGVVTGPDGLTPLEGIQVSDGGGGWESAMTGYDGIYEITGLDAGSYVVQFSPPSWSPYVSEYYNDSLRFDRSTAVAVSAGIMVAGIDASLALGGNIRGRVTGPDGVTPLEGVDVYAFGAADSGGYGYATTDSDGTYEITGLAAGGYNVQFRANSGSPYVPEYYDDARGWWSWTVVPVLSGEATASINASLSVGGSIRGRVTAADGVTPLTDVSVSAFPRSGSTYNWATTGHDGAYEVTCLAADDYRVAFSAPWGSHYAAEFYNNALWSSAAPVSVPPGGTVSDINVSLELGGAVSGAVTGPDGVTPLEGVGVFELLQDGEVVQISQTKADGSYEAARLQEGSYRIGFVPASGSPFAFEYFSNAVTPSSATSVPVLSGPPVTAINASLEFGAKVSGVVTDSNGQPVPHVSVEPLRWTGSEWAELPLGDSVDFDGTYTVEGLAAGEYVFRFELTGYEVLFLGGVGDISGATRIVLNPGDSLQNLNIVLPEEQPWARIDGLSRTAPGLFQMTFAGSLGKRFQLQKSGTLHSWTNLGTPVPAIPDNWNNDGFVGTNSIPIGTTATKEFWPLLEAQP